MNNVTYFSLKTGESDVSPRKNSSKCLISFKASTSRDLKFSVIFFFLLFVYVICGTKTGIDIAYTCTWWLFIAKMWIGYVLGLIKVSVEKNV